MPTTERLIGFALAAALATTVALSGSQASPEPSERSQAPNTAVEAAVASEAVLADLRPAPAPPPTTTTVPPPSTTTTAAPKPRPATAPPPTAEGNCGGWDDLISAYFPNEVQKACSVMMCESKGNPTAQNSSSSASGLWQFLDSTYESVTGTPGPASQYSAETQTAAAASLVDSSGWGQWSCR